MLGTRDRSNIMINDSDTLEAERCRERDDVIENFRTSGMQAQEVA
jgi:hypothetical protein